MTITFSRKPTRLGDTTVLRVSNLELSAQLLAFMQEMDAFDHDGMKTIADAMAIISSKENA